MTGEPAKHWPFTPFGRIGAALGFRWIMPIGTLPLPYHPWLARLLPWGILALIGHRVATVANGDTSGVTWWGLLIAASLLALPMLVPVVSWLAMAFRVPLLQGLLFGGAMLLLAIDSVTGAAPGWALAAPAAWLGLFLVQSVGGPIYLRQLQAANDAFPMIEPGDRLIIVEGDNVAASRAAWLVQHQAVARVAIEPALSGRSTKLAAQTYYRLAPVDAAALGGRLERMGRPKGWSAGKDYLLAPGIADAPGIPIRLRAQRHRAPLWLVAGHREALEVDDGADLRRLVGGQAASVDRWPFFTFFYWVSILGKSQWVAGFARKKPVELGPARFYDMVTRLFSPASEHGPFADPAPLHAALDVFESEEAAEGAALLAALLRLDPELPPGWGRLARRPALLAANAGRLCDCLAAAKEAKHEQAVWTAAHLLAALPPEAYRAIGARLLTLLNSKELAFRLLGGDDPGLIERPEAERREHVIGGFSLIKYVPELYERLAELGEAARPLITGLGATGRWPKPLVRAREQLDGQPGDS